MAESVTQVRTAVTFNAKTCNTRIETAEPGPSTSRTSSRRNTLTTVNAPSVVYENVVYLDFTYCHVILLFLSLVTYCLDIALACYISYYYFMQERFILFILTVMFTFIPILLTTGFSMRW